MMSKAVVAVVLFLAVAASGCGGSSHTTPSPKAQAEAVCKDGFRELETIDGHLADGAPALVGQQVIDAAKASIAVDSATTTRLRALPNSGAKQAVLAKLGQSRSQLQAIVSALHRNGYEHRQLSKELGEVFLRANGGCGVVKLTNPT
jgi:hypothetical protein